jgi:hypothetical protein
MDINISWNVAGRYQRAKSCLSRRSRRSTRTKRNSARYRARVPGALFSGIKRPGRETDNSPPSSAEVKNDGATPPPLYKLHGVVID